MLTDLSDLSQQLKEEYSRITDWNEIELSEQLKIDLKSCLENVSDMKNKTGIMTTSDNNLVIFPYQYFGLASNLQDFCRCLNEYVEYFEICRDRLQPTVFAEIIYSISNHFANNTIVLLNYESLVRDRNEKYGEFDVLLNDFFSGVHNKILYLNFLCNKHYRKGKEIANFSGGQYKLRTIEDFYGSIILGIVNLPNASSAIFGGIIYSLSKNMELYDRLKIEVSSQIVPSRNFSDSTLTTFVLRTFKAIIELGLIEDLISVVTPNGDDQFYSLEIENHRLTSLFWVYDHDTPPEERLQAGRKRTFDELIYTNGGNYYYLCDQWSDNGVGRLDFVNLEFIINKIFSDHLVISKDETNFYCLKLIKKIKEAHQRIIYGAAGTGKSFKLKSEAEKMFSKENIQRVTFHPDYSYAKFVGTYKPSPIYMSVVADDTTTYYTSKGEKSGNDRRHPLIDYTFIPGALLDSLINALTNKNENFLLIIEEINRANVAAVFGDVFQLLDRNSVGESEYEIELSPDAMLYFQEKTGHNKVSFPSNLYIWSTMNSADQGVYPMDTAFKRRWSFEYIPINHEQNKADHEINFGRNGGQEEIKVKWNEFRNKINNELLTKNYPEDKLIGPFFINSNEISDINIFANKLLLYLRDDVVRHNPSQLFKVANMDYSFSTLLKFFLTDINNLFHFEVYSSPLTIENRIVEE